MDRKLDASEGARSFSPESDVNGPVQVMSDLRQDLQNRIAQQLGISAAELRDPGETPNAVHSASNPFQSTDTALSRECLELLDAYIRITDVEQRRRCLQAVRDVASAAADEGPVEEA